MPPLLQVDLDSNQNTDCTLCSTELMGVNWCSSTESEGNARPFIRPGRMEMRLDLSQMIDDGDAEIGSPVSEWGCERVSWDSPHWGGLVDIGNHGHKPRSAPPAACALDEDAVADERRRR